MWELKEGSVFDVLPSLDAQSVQCCVTSPPYWGLRDYNVDGQLGLEKTPEEYVANMVRVFREVRRVLRDDGTFWLNIGDSYNSKSDLTRNDAKAKKVLRDLPRKQRAAVPSLKPKDLVGIPWMVAFALRADGWYLRSEIIWAKVNPMPESVTDRPTKAHEQVFLFSKSPRYFYDWKAIAQTARSESERKSVPSRGHSTGAERGKLNNNPDRDGGFSNSGIVNARTVWWFVSEPTAEAHFATFPEALPRRCIKAATRIGDTVLDPFNGSGTTGLVATSMRRNYIGIELNPEYAAMTRERFWNAPPPGLGMTTREAKRAAK